MTTWLITGCSSGLGCHLAHAVLQAGFNAVVTARNAATVQDIVAAYPDTAVAAALDVTDRAQVDAAVELAHTRFGGVDVLVNNAGHGYRAAVEEADEQEVAALFASNFFGAVSTIKAVLPGMRARRAGTIVNVSSIAGRLAMPGSAYYSATKFALEGLSDALRKEVEPLGIKVMVVDPGAFRTDFAGRSLQQAKANIADYAATAGPRRKENDHTHGTQPGDPARAALAVIEAVTGDRLPFRLLLGSDAIQIVTDELQAQLREIEDWKRLSASTDFPEQH
ncbi:Short-chain dehydrogenase/reductase SDR protein [Azotobacter vinelandii CA]|uniref:Short-chain dehydrogenase/reductase SDR protein n=3 Tax=Azotobacter group TaxID=351 RepID=C1DP58_AZOVD|nr:oxidoreductase [Azotobacter vinelandii]ACO79411.1 Short-chain dehydrogenase/reductase SDR protein [Azotobacter vinelandii DJ]AGK14695.1 Short-chain dehydrogenase/reductase SDR protein [Azotobacter vinelandii CA]AGK21204.1 Short-chain dehydrogenase/reductase SDR protein [Azotobacter vinelandii CA6]SFY22267.1 NADP-dependent 3-hydroxy acid dehydrogenase YdfG [Azotobacter vinelandii]